MPKEHSASFLKFDPKRVPSPCFVVDEVAVERNLQTLANIQTQSGAKVLLALKAFSMFSIAPLISRYLTGTCASGLFEAKLGREEFGGKVHTFSAAFHPNDIDEILALSDHVVFNSEGQWSQFKDRAIAQQQKKKRLQFGLRVNPMHSEGSVDIYDPCAANSRLGIPIDRLADIELTGISGLHFHTLCEQNFAPLARTLDVTEAKLGGLLHKMTWLNLGGGHHITAPGYDTAQLINRVKHLQNTYSLQVYLEPGEAIAINTGVLVSEVLDLTRNGKALAILDTSATCHMPDTLEMPYRAHIFGAGEDGEKPFSYRLGGQTCLAGDVMGDYSFDEALYIGQRLMFDDMSHYTMVKTSMFNGINLPAIALWNSTSDELSVIKSFGYSDFKSRLS